jgi:F-type H+-transporting ATPase subunit delta
MLNVTASCPALFCVVLLQLEQVLLPGVEGYFGVKANHVPIIAQLQPGVVELHDGADVTKYFVSGGFAFVHPNSVTDICVLEAATLDQFDSTAVKQALQVGLAPESFTFIPAS